MRLLPNSTDRNQIGNLFDLDWSLGVKIIDNGEIKIFDDSIDIYGKKRK